MEGRGGWNRRIMRGKKFKILQFYVMSYDVVEVEKPCENQWGCVVLLSSLGQVGPREI